MIYNKTTLLLFFSVLLGVITGCNYSFTGASIPPHLHSVAIPLFDDRSGSGEPNLGEDFTTDLTDKFIDDNNLQIKEKTDADAIVEGTVTSLKETPASVGVNDQGDEAISQIKVTLAVRVVYKDFVTRETVFDRTFSDYGLYSNTSSNVTEAREEAIADAIDKITDDILTAVVADW